MNYKEEIIRYRLERAEETYQEALLMQREKYWNTCANRLYYACFYAVSALLQQHDFSSGKHSGVKAFFNQHFVKTGILDKEFWRLYTGCLMPDRRETILILSDTLLRMSSLG